RRDVQAQVSKTTQNDQEQMGCRDCRSGLITQPDRRQLRGFGFGQHATASARDYAHELWDAYGARVFHWICISCWPGLIFGDHSFTSGHLIDQSPGGPNFLDWPVNLLPVTMRQSGLPFMATVGQNASLCE